MQGWISIHRQIFDNKLWKEKPFDRARAWIDMILLANHKGGDTIIKGQVLTYKRGELLWSMKGLSERWGWSRGKVERFLRMLKNEHQIGHQKMSITSRISIINYDRFQITDTKTDIRRTSDGHQTDTDNNDNKYNKDNKREHTREDWDDFASEQDEVNEVLTSLNNLAGTSFKDPGFGVRRMVRERIDQHGRDEVMKVVEWTVSDVLKNGKRSWLQPTNMFRQDSFEKNQASMIDSPSRPEI